MISLVLQCGYKLGEGKICDGRMIYRGGMDGHLLRQSGVSDRGVGGRDRG